MYGKQGAALGQVATNARDEALYLILRTLGIPLESGAAVLDRKLSSSESAALDDVFRRRLEDRVPAAYITGEAWLGGLRFHVDERVLIPRSYFVEILEHQVDPWIADLPKVNRVADVCTGSGCLAVLLSRHFKKARVDGIDVSPEALEVAKLNVRRHRMGARVRLLIVGGAAGLGPAGEHRLGPGEQVLLPTVDQRRVDAVVPGQLVDGLVPLVSGQCDLRLERW